MERITYIYENKLSSSGPEVQQTWAGVQFPELPAHLGQSPNSNEGIAGHGQPQQQGQYGGMQMGPEGHFMQAGHMGAPGQYGHMPMGPFLMPHGMHQHLHPGMQVCIPPCTTTYGISTNVVARHGRKGNKAF